MIMRAKLPKQGDRHADSVKIWWRRERGARGRKILLDVFLPAKVMATLCCSRVVEDLEADWTLHRCRKVPEI